MTPKKKSEQTRFIVTPTKISIWKGSKNKIFNGPDDQYNKVLNALKLLKTDPVKAEQIIDCMFDNSKQFIKYTRGRFKIDHHNSIVIDQSTGTAINGTILRRILDWDKNGLPVEPLFKFITKLSANPNIESTGLYDFLEAGNIPLTKDGTFIGYKKVRRKNNKLVDCYTELIDNSVGRTVSMDREKVIADRSQACSAGLHVGAYEYVNGFSGDTIIEVEVDPFNVVSVPHDYENQKMRVCEYKVLREFNGNKEPDNKLYIEIPSGKMTARQLKQWAKNYYNRVIGLSDKNKKGVLKICLQLYHKK